MPEQFHHLTSTSSLLNTSIVNQFQIFFSVYPTFSMPFRLGDVPRELVAEFAHHLDNPSFANLSQTCKDLYQLLGPELTKRAEQVSLAPRQMYEEQYEYADDQKEGVDEPLFLLDRPLLSPDFVPVEGEVFGNAVLAGNLDTVTFLLKAGVNPNSYIVAGTRMLSLAVQSMNILMVSLLLQYGANPVLKDLIEDMSPLAHAAQSRRDDMVELLINAGGDLAEFNVLGCIVRGCGSRILDLCISRGANFAAVGKAGYTVLHYLVSRNDLEIFNLVIPHIPGDMLDAVTVMGRTALHFAVLNTDARLAKPLLSLGVDMNARDSTGYTALHLALKKRHLLLAHDLLARGCQLGVVNQEGETELHLAIQTRQADLVCMLLQRNVDINAHNANAATPLHYAVRLRDAAMVNVLLTEGATRPDLEIKDAAGRTALQEANALGETAIASLFS